jgi:PAS domain S-box-containing protein
MDGLIDVYNKMIEQLRKERIMHQEQNFFLDLLINASPAGIIILNYDNKVISINPSAEKILNISSDEIISKKLVEIKKVPFAELDRLEDNKSIILRMSGINTLKAQKAHFTHRGSKHHFILLEELTEEIRKSEKKSYEKIIRMMSHEINNSIGAVNSILSTFLSFSDQLKETHRKDFENAINVAIERNNSLNKFMTNFADVVRIPAPVKRKNDLSKLLKDVIALMEPVCAERDIKIDISGGNNVDLVNFDVQQMELVLVNIVKNSIESIDQNGEIRINIENNSHPELIISDNGAGIPDEIRDNLFTPFFSSKKNGQGIGLTLIREILTNHNFQFSLSTNENNITEFRIIFKN